MNKARIRLGGKTEKKLGNEVKKMIFITTEANNALNKLIERSDVRLSRTAMVNALILHAFSNGIQVKMNGGGDNE